MSTGSGVAAPAPERRIFCNRTLNLRAIDAIGYDMDYTLIHYREREWERRAYEYVRAKLGEQGWPVDGLEYDHERMVRGLVLDVERGNIVKVNRFGYVKQAFHGTRALSWPEVREAYSRTIANLGEPRFEFLNTLFSLSEACIYAQLVDVLDDGRAPAVLGYPELRQQVARSLSEAHMEGQLKADILADPDRYVVPDPDLALTLLDQRHAGKRLLLITNSEWAYTRAMMSHAFDAALPDGQVWTDLFEVIIVEARKPSFFADRNAMFEVVDQDAGTLRPAVGGLRAGRVHLGGHAGLVEEFLGLSGDQILYVGDHIWGDVRVTKSVLRWRTCLVLRELEGEIEANGGFEPQQAELRRRMGAKQRLEAEHCRLRLTRQRLHHGYGPPSAHQPRELRAAEDELWARMQAMDAEIAPLARASSALSHPIWGPLMRAGNDKSMLARQVERSADIYTSRVSNLGAVTPFAYLRSPRGSLPHDPLDPPAGSDA